MVAMEIAGFRSEAGTQSGRITRFLGPLVDAGVDVFHCSTRRFWEPEFAGSDLNLAGWTKKLTGKPTITVGSVTLDQDLIDIVWQRRHGGSDQHRQSAGAIGTRRVRSGGHRALVDRESNLAGIVRRGAWSELRRSIARCWLN